jgi:hypothetical protein
LHLKENKTLHNYKARFGNSVENNRLLDLETWNPKMQKAELLIVKESFVYMYHLALKGS